jgi:hypothetical protein
MTLLIKIFAFQPHLHIKLEVIFLSICTYGIVNLELLIVFVHLELAAGTSFSLNRSGELCAFVLRNLPIGERGQGRHGEYCYRHDQSHEQSSSCGTGSERFAPTSTYNSNASDRQTFRKSRRPAAPCSTDGCWNEAETARNPYCIGIGEWRSQQDSNLQPTE